MEPGETITFVLPCDNETKITLILFTEVSNCAELKKAARAGKVGASLLKNSLILDEFQVLVAANLAVQSKNMNCMTTRNIHTEIMFHMSCTKNITESLNTFSVGEKDTSFLAVLMNAGDKEVVELKEQVRGKICTPLNLHLKTLCDRENIKKVYKVKNEENRVNLLNLMVSKIAAKELMSF